MSRKRHPMPPVERAPMYRTSKYVPFVSFPGVTAKARRKVAMTQRNRQMRGKITLAPVRGAESES